jgi:hypothetical protein
MGKDTATEAGGRLVPAVRAAREVGIPYTSLRDAAFRGQIPVVKVGRAWYFDRGDLSRFVSAAKVNLGDGRSA